MVKPKLEKAWDFSEGVASVRYNGGARGYIDRNGKRLFDTSRMNNVEALNYIASSGLIGFSIRQATKADNESRCDQEREMLERKGTFDRNPGKAKFIMSSRGC